MENSSSNDDKMPSIKIINDSGGEPPATAAQRHDMPPTLSEPVTTDVEEGIIYRNHPHSSGNNSKMHFISNLTLIAKQQQHQQTPRGSGGQNIIFLNNASAGNPGPAHGAASKLNCTSATTTNYINAFVSKGIATTASGKVVNLLQPGGKGPNTLVGSKPARGKGVQLQKQARNIQMISRTTPGGTQLQATNKPSNVVINASSKAQVGGKFTSSEPHKQLNIGKFAKATALMAQNKVRTTQQLKQQQQPMKVVTHGQQVNHQKICEDSPAGDATLQYPAAVIKVQQGKPNMLKTAVTPSLGSLAGKNVVYSQVVVSSNGGFALTSSPSKNQAVRLPPQEVLRQTVKPRIARYSEGGGSSETEGACGATSVIQFGAGIEKVPEQAVQEEVYYVNGTQMSDEMSARLLQNFSQKAASRFAAQNTHYFPESTETSPNYQYSAQQTKMPQVESSGGLIVNR